MAIRGWAKANGHTVTILPPELDESGGREDRPILLKALAGIERGTYDGLVAYDLSRIMRDTRALLDLVDRVMDRGGKVETVEGDIDWLTSMGRMFGTFKAAIDEQVRREKSELFLRVNRNTAERGYWKFRQVPRGYRLAGERPCGLVPSKDAPKVRWAFKARLTTPPTPLSTIANKLGMTNSGTRALLRNRVYLGEIIVGATVNREAHEALVDRATFDAVQALRSVRPARSNSGAPAPLAGLVRCGGCGHVMSLNRHGRGSYHCKFDHSGEAGCPSRAAVTAEVLEEHVFAKAREFAATAAISTSRRTDEIERLRDDLQKAQSELAAYLEATEVAGLGVEQFVAGSRRRAQDAADAQSALDSAYTLAPLGGMFESGKDFWDDLNVHERNRFLRGLVDAIVVRSAGKGRNVPVAERVRVFKHGTLGDLAYRGGGKPMPVRTLPFPELDDERLLGVPRSEDVLGGAGR